MKKYFFAVINVALTNSSCIKDWRGFVLEIFTQNLDLENYELKLDSWLV